MEVPQLRGLPHVPSGPRIVQLAAVYLTNTLPQRYLEKRSASAQRVTASTINRYVNDVAAYASTIDALDTLGPLGPV